MTFGPLRQLAAALVGAPLALLRLPRKSWGYFALYLGLCAAVLGVTAYYIFRSQNLAQALVLDYLFPESWHWALSALVDRFLAAQSREVIANAAIAGSLLMVSLLLFPFKEMLSASYEREANLIGEPVSEHPLWEQGWEEIKLFLGYLAVQGTVFWIGYSPETWRQSTALILSYAFLFTTYAIDFVAPPLQRHRGHYSRILKTLAAHPVATLVFGAVFAAPGIAAGLLWRANPEWSLEKAVAIICAVNVFGIAWAAVAGTWLGSRLFADFKATRRSAPVTRVLAWVLLGSLLLANAYAFGAVAGAIHKKSQILKCDYSVAWSSFRLDRPGLGALLSDRVELGVRFEVEIENPTSFPVEIEENRLELRHRGDLLGTGALAPFRVEPGERVTREVGLALAVTPSFLARRNTELIEREHWTVTLYLEVAPGFEFPVYLLE